MSEADGFRQTPEIFHLSFIRASPRLDDIGRTFRTIRPWKQRLRTGACLPVSTAFRRRFAADSPAG
ncbi:hypothetical protein [Burkholderia ambifaria]|uniref:hypothetical protein n=1 Tax=Burkholderia ambifaria TaxID=152480 RepID=UPI001588FFBC|nr:hypothetical protein [Burkholderia ambifaria]